MKNILSIFSCKKNKIIEELNRELAKANAKIAALETANKELKRVNDQLGTALKAAEKERIELAQALETEQIGRERTWATLGKVRKELGDVRAKLREAEAKNPKRAKNGRFAKKEKQQ